jgi:hypothetical protein
MMRFISCIIILLFPISVFAQETQACAERSRVVQKLHEKFGETLRSFGLRDNVVVEVYSSEETGTWTILMTRPDGMSCLLAAGQAWEIIPPGDPA